MGDETVTISDGDEITLATHSDGELSINIQNTAFVEPTRWLSIAVAGSNDRDRAIDDLKKALPLLRDVDQL